MFSRRWNIPFCGALTRSGRRQFNSFRKSPKLTRFRIIINYKDYCEILSDKLELPKRGSDNTSSTGKKQRPASPPKQLISRPRWVSDHLTFLKETVELSASYALSFRFLTFLSATHAGVSFDDAAVFGSFSAPESNPNKNRRFTKLDLGGIYTFICCQFPIWDE